MQSEQFEIITHDGLTLIARSWLPGSKPKGAICIVHGLGEHSGRYENITKPFLLKNYSILAFDLRGHGLSEGPRGHLGRLDMVLDDINLVISKSPGFYDKIPFILYGHGLGGLLSLAYTLKKKHEIVKACIASSPWLEMAFNMPEWKLRLGRLIAAFYPQFGVKTGYIIQNISRDQNIVKDFLKDPLHHDIISAGSFFQIKKAIELCENHAYNFNIPVLLNHGTSNKIVSHHSTEKLHERSGNRTQLKLWKGYKHELHHEPENETYINFLQDWIWEVT